MKHIKFSFIKPRIGLLIFDKDGTLVNSMGERPPNSINEQTYMPELLRHREHILQSEYTKAVASNQGGVAFRKMSWQDANQLVREACMMIGGMDYRFAPNHPKATDKQWRRESQYRKPAPGMLLAIMDLLGYDANQTLFIGDSEAEDQLAAKYAGCEFMLASKFWSEMDNLFGLVKDE